MNCDAESESHPDKYDQYLVTLGDADDLGPAKSRVGDYHPTRQPDRQVQAPAEQRGQNDGWRINRNPGGQTALNQKQKCAEQPRLLIETLSEIFVSRVNLEALENRYENRADGDQGEGLSEIILDKTDAALVSQARHREEGDWPRLRSEHGQANCGPADTRVTLEIVAERFTTARPPQTVERDREDRRDQDDVIEPVHENTTVKA